MGKHIYTSAINIILFILLAQTGTIALYAEELVLGANSYCPYTCINTEDPNSQFSGYQVDVLYEIAQQQGLTIKIIILPWSRALKMVNAGKIDGLLAIGEHEVTDASFTTDIYNELTGCFMTRKENPWTFAGTDSLLSLRLGLVKDYGYPPAIAAHVKQYNQGGLNIQYVASNNAQLQNLRKLVAGRIDTTFDDIEVLNWIAKQHNLLGKVKVAGCLPEETVRCYTIISKNIPRAREYVEKINKGYAILRQSGRARQLLEKYDIGQKGSK